MLFKLVRKHVFLIAIGIFQLTAEIYADCPFGNDEPAYPTCDFRLALQNSYSEFNLAPYGLSNDAYVISGIYFLAGKTNDCDGNSEDFDAEMCVKKFLSYTEEDVRNKFIPYLNNHSFLKTTPHMVMLDFEPPGILLQALFAYKDVYYDDNPAMDVRDRGIEAYKMRVRIARELMPEAKLVLYATGRYSDDGKQTEKDDLRMESYIHAGQKGLYDELDYLCPNLYIRYGAPEFDTYDEYLDVIEKLTRNGIERTEPIRKSDGSSIPLMPLLSIEIEPFSPYNYLVLDDQAAKKQLQVLKDYSHIKMLVYWSAKSLPTYEKIPAFMERVKPVPSFCFCSQNFDKDSKSDGIRILTCMDLNDSQHRKNPPICYELGEESQVRIMLYARNGDLVRHLLNENQSAGTHTITWDRKNDDGEIVASGAYSVVIEAGAEKIDSKIMVIK